APGVDDLQRAQSVSRGDGGRAAGRAGPGGARSPVRGGRRQADPVVGVQPLRAHDRARSHPSHATIGAGDAGSRIRAGREPVAGGRGGGRAVGWWTQGRMPRTARLVQQAQGNQALAILGTLLIVYIVLGVLYESYVHPLTILSTLPSAGVGAFLALAVLQTEF